MTPIKEGKRLPPPFRRRT